MQKELVRIETYLQNWSGLKLAVIYFFSAVTKRLSPSGFMGTDKVKKPDTVTRQGDVCLSNNRVKIPHAF